MSPNFLLEKDLMESGYSIIAGVDEVGRGPLAGPVTAAAVILDPLNIPDNLNDSKLLSLKKREKIYEELVYSSTFAISHVSPEEIDKLNILQASLLAMVNAVSKLNVHNSVKKLRIKYEWPIVSGIMFNHESEFREDKYLYMKIVNFAIKTKKNETKEPLMLGSLEYRRDWSYAQDITQAAIMMLRSENKNDYVLGSGGSYSIQEIVEIVFNSFDLNWNKYIHIDPSLLREGDPQEIISDPSKIKNELGWSTTTSIENVIEKIINFKKN